MVGNRHFDPPVGGEKSVVHKRYSAVNKDFSSYFVEMTLLFIYRHFDPPVGGEKSVVPQTLLVLSTKDFSSYLVEMTLLLNLPSLRSAGWRREVCCSPIIWSLL
jgi:hypothetical protein